MAGVSGREGKEDWTEADEDDRVRALSETDMTAVAAAVAASDDAVLVDGALARDGHGRVLLRSPRSSPKGDSPRDSDGSG